MNKDPQVLHNKLLREIKPSFRYDGGEDFSEWQKRARARLCSLIGLDKLTPAEDDCFTIEYANDCGDFTDYRMTFQSEEGYFVVCSLWKPNNKEGKIPMVVCVQGHSKGYHISLGRPIYESDERAISCGDRDFAVQIVKQGYCALAIEQRAFGECGGTPEGPNCPLPTLDALLMGRTMIGERVFDISRTIDVVLAHFDFIDEKCIGLMGNSGGGTATTYASAIDERIKVAMPSCAVCTYKDSIGAMKHCTCNYVPNIALDFDMGDLCGLIAPRKLVIVSGAEDPIFPRNGVAESFEVAKTYFAAAGVPDDVQWVEGPEGHRFYAAQAWPVFNKFFV